MRLCVVDADGQGPVVGSDWLSDGLAVSPSLSPRSCTHTHNKPPCLNLTTQTTSPTQTPQQQVAEQALFPPGQSQLAPGQKLELDKIAFPRLKVCICS